MTEQKQKSNEMKSQTKQTSKTNETNKTKQNKTKQNKTKQTEFFLLNTNPCVARAVMFDAWNEMPPKGAVRFTPPRGKMVRLTHCTSDRTTKESEDTDILALTIPGAGPVLTV